MPRDRSRSVLPQNAMVAWLGLCMGAAAIGIGCSPAMPNPNPARLKLMQEKSRAYVRSKTIKKSPSPASLKSIPPRTDRSQINACPFVQSPGRSSFGPQGVYRSLYPC
jgi:hypothetical protein